MRERLTTYYAPDTGACNGKTYDVQQMHLKEWVTNIVPEPKSMPQTAEQEGKELVKRWESCFPKENTWVQRELGVPSLIVRLDATLEGEHLRAYEVEERPAGIGVSYTTNPAFKERLQDVARTWPKFDVVISERRNGHDDQLWTPLKSREEAVKGTELVLVRAEPEEEEFHCLEDRSVSSLKQKGDKSYGEKLGLWRKVQTPEDLPAPCEPFVLKPLQGSKTRDVFMYLPNSMAKSQYSIPELKMTAPGAYTRSRVERELIRHTQGSGGMYCQPFYPPVESGLDGDMGKNYRWMIYRVYYGLNTQTREWNYLGGQWNARNNLKIHGDGDAVIGPVV